MTDRIYLDSAAILSAFLGPTDPCYDGAIAALGAAQAGAFQPVISALVIAEVVGAPNVRAEQGVSPSACRAKQAKAREFVEGLGALYVELSEADGGEAAELSRQHNLGGADALHLAAALRHRCTTMFTSDGGLLKVDGRLEGIRLLAPDWASAQLDFNE